MAVLILATAGLGIWLWQRPRGPNLLLITLDTTRADRIGYHAYKGAHTPCLDRLAAEGVWFEQALANVPLTLPSHATMLTGLLPPEHGLHVNAMGELPPDIPTLAEQLAARGYRTGAFIAAFVLDHQFGLNRGFDTYDDDLTGVRGTNELQFSRRRKADAVVNAALNWFKQSRGSWSALKKPYFCWVHLYDPHHPCDEHRAEFDVRFAGRAYDAEIAYADREIQRLLDSLRARGELENTLIVVAGDHGESLGEHMEDNHGLQLYQSTLLVPLLFHWPERLSADRRVSDTVSLVDLTPTIMDLLQLGSLKKSSGRSLVPALDGMPLDPRPVIAETYEPYFGMHASPQQVFIHDGWKYIRSRDPELYRSTDDPAETSNLATLEPAKLQELEVLRKDYYGGLTKVTAGSANVDQRAADILRSLSYTGGNHVLPNEEAFTKFPDVKVMLLPMRLTQAALHLRDTKPEEAERHLKLVAEKYPQLIRGRMHYAETLAQRADSIRDDVAQSTAKFQEAVKICRKIIEDEKLLPEAEWTWEAHLILAGALERLGQLPESDAAYDEASRIQPNNAKVHVSRAMSLLSRGRSVDAAVFLDIAVRLDPAQALAQYELAKIRFSQGRVDEALEAFRLAARHNPQLVDAHFQAVQILRIQKRWSEAIAMLTKLLELFPQDQRIAGEANRLLNECQQQQ